MKTERNILIAFLLNMGFSIFEFVGGVITGSVAIASDAVHDLGDALSIGISLILEKVSKRSPDSQYTYGYARYSVLGSLLTTLILVFGSAVVIHNAVGRIINPEEIHYDGMILFAVVGVCVNLVAAFATRDGDSLNHKAVNLHMLEDVLGWLVVLVGAVVMRFTDVTIIDPLLSVGVAGFILLHAMKNLQEILALFLEKTPKGMNLEEIRNHLMALDGVADVHHIHVWSMDGVNHRATMHVVVSGDGHEIKSRLRAELQEHGIGHVTLELETEGEHCHEETCRIMPLPSHGHHCHQ